MKIIFFLSVGRLHAQKNYPFLIKCFSKSNLKNVKLIILGEGDERKKLEKLVKKYKMTNQIKLLGNVSDPYIYYNNAKAFFLMSNFEGSPNVLWEAISCNLPCVISKNISGAFEILNDKINFFAVDHNNESQLIKLMKGFINNEEKYIKSYNGLEYLNKVFNKKEIIKKWDSLIFKELT